MPDSPRGEAQSATTRTLQLLFLFSATGSEPICWSYSTWRVGSLLYFIYGGICFGLYIIAKKKVKRMARPSKYESHVQPKLLLIEAWARDGLTVEQIADNLGVAAGTFYEYQKQYPELIEALKNGREVIDVMVENALLKAALGYDYTEEELNKITGEPIALRKMAHPNTTALIFWLKNRRPKEWRDKQELEHSGEAGVRIINDIPRSSK